MNIETPFIVVSCDRSENTPEVATSRRDTFEHQIRALGHAFIPVTGKYKGLPERAFLVLAPDTATEENIFRLARRYGQESVLLVDANRYATLAFLNPDVGGPAVKELKGIGFWREVTREEAGLQAGFTYADGRYFTTKALP